MMMRTKERQHILVICQYFFPEEFRINDICKEWIKRGYEVTVVTGIPNYPQGKFYKGYSWFSKTHEEYEGIHVIRIPIIPRGKNSIMMILNYISFVISGFFWKILTKVKADKVFIFQLSPMTQALVGVWYAKKRKIPCYIYVQDLWPESVQAVTGIHNKSVINMIDRIVNYVYKNSTKIFATSPSFVKKIEERESAFQDKESKVIYWPQYAEEFYQPMARESARKQISTAEVGEDDELKIVFTGNIGYAQGLDILPKVAKLLKEEKIRCSFYIIGDGRYREELVKEIEKAEASDIFKLLGRKKPVEIPAYLSLMDVAFLSFAENFLYSMTIPAKLQSYMGCGMPILAVAEGETKRIIEEARCGFCCEIREPKEVVYAIKKFIENKNQLKEMRVNAKQYNEKEFNKIELLNTMDVWLMS